MFPLLNIASFLEIIYKNQKEMKLKLNFNKTALAIAVLTGFCCIMNPDFATAQGNNLQFNQVIMVGSTALTVPANKVWKVESCLSVRTNSCGSSSCPSEHAILVNNQTVNVGDGSSYSGQYGGIENATTFPFWLPATYYLKTSSNVIYISVIEFNIVP
jgi:hypothetical protein